MRITAVLCLMLVILGAASDGLAAGPLKLRYGVAAFKDLDPIEESSALAALGADYVEPALSKVAAMSDEQFEAARRKVESSPVRVEVMNWFVPGDIRLTGPAVDRNAIHQYLEKSLGRAEKLGAKVVVFGSPGARSCPDGFPKDKAWQQLRQFLLDCAETIDRHKYGMVIAIEPLRRAESNMINTAEDGLRLAREVNHPKIRLHVDFYHLRVENENPDIILKARGYIAHLHMALPQARTFPRDESEDPFFKPFFENLGKIGFDGRISLEGNYTSRDEEIREGIRFLKKMTAKYGRQK